MSDNELFAKISIDPQFQKAAAVAERAMKKANDKAQAKIDALEEREIERHRSAMAAIYQRRHAARRKAEDAYTAIEQAAYNAALIRISKTDA